MITSLYVITLLKMHLLSKKSSLLTNNFFLGVDYLQSFTYNGFMYWVNIVCLLLSMNKYSGLQKNQFNNYELYYN